MLRQMKADGTVAEINASGMGKLYISSSEKQELDALKEAAAPLKEGRMRILSLMDPYTQYNWSQVYQRYGDRWIYPIFVNGKVAGMLEKWRMSGCVEVRDIQLDDPLLLEELVEELDHMMEYYNALGVDVLRITNVLGKDVPDMGRKTLSLFKRQGYHQLNGTLVKGNIMPRAFTKDEITSYIMYKQHVHPPTHFKNTMQCVKDMGGIWTDAEASLRTAKHTSLGEFVRKDALVMTKIIPHYLSYCTKEDAGLYQAARATPLSDNMKVVLRIIHQNDGISLGNVFVESPLGRDDTKEELKRLYDGAYVARKAGAWNRYTAIARPKMRQRTAMYTVLDRLSRGKVGW
jgi:ATP-dependent Lhr-like helicase